MEPVPASTSTVAVLLRLLTMEEWVMVAKWIAVIALLILGTLTPILAKAERFAGTWKGASFAGSPPNWPQECPLIAWRDHVIELAEMEGQPGRYTGGMIQFVTLMTLDRPPCRLTGAKSAHTGAQVKQWTLEGQAAADGSIEIVAHSGKCSESYCGGDGYPGLLPPGAADFDTVFAIDSKGRLIDTYGSSEPSDDIALLKRDEYERQISLPSKEAGQIVQEFGRGQCDEFADRVVKQFQDRRQDHVAGCDKAAVALGRVSRHVELTKLYFPARPGQRDVGDFWMYQYGLTSENAQGSLFLTFTREGGEYRLWHWLLR